MKNNNTQLLNEISGYYTTKLQQHGETPRGVDWNSEESQILRFQQLCKIIDTTNHFSLNDLGCGYGALYKFLSHRCASFFYTGIDVSSDMVQAATQRYQDDSKANFLLASEPKENADYGIASGIFNVRLNCSDEEWRLYCEGILNTLDKTSRLGFSFNCLTSYSDTDKMKDYLYYADPCVLFDLCKRHYSKNVVLLHDYGLYEFTILVRK